MTYARPDILINATELQAALADKAVKVFDAAVHLKPQPGGTYQVESGCDGYRKGHIPGAGFIDLANDWADSSSELRFTLPGIDDLAAAIGRSGISNTDRVVIYSSGHLMWATRAWWLLHYAGHQNIAILNGNLKAWTDAGYPLSDGEEAYPPAEFSPAVRPEKFTSTSEVEQGMHGVVCTINALSRSLYEGTGDFYYSRPGHIPGSHLLYYDELLDNEYFLPADALQAKLASIGVTTSERVVTYCGGGIAATLDAFACTLIGHDNVGVYDGSMSEWVQDEHRPLTVGSNP